MALKDPVGLFQRLNAACPFNKVTVIDSSNLKRIKNTHVRIPHNYVSGI